MSMQGRCGFCERETLYLEKDHRVPPRLGGSRGGEWNIQYLCPECHRMKTQLEGELFDFNCETPFILEWFKVAFQNDSKNISRFVDHLVLRAHHFLEIKNRFFHAPSDMSLLEYLEKAEAHRPVHG